MTLTPEQLKQIEAEADLFAEYDGETSRGVPVKCIDGDKHAGYVAGATKYLTLLEAANKEIERLKGLIRSAFENGFNNPDDPSVWDSFKQQHNL